MTDMVSVLLPEVKTIRSFAGRVNKAALRMVLRDCDRLFRFVQVLLKVGHEWRAAGSDAGGIAVVRLMLAVDIAVGITDMDLAEMGKQFHASAIRRPKVRAIGPVVTNVARKQRPAPIVDGLFEAL